MGLRANNSFLTQQWLVLLPEADCVYYTVGNTIEDKFLPESLKFYIWSVKVFVYLCLNFSYFESPTPRVWPKKCLNYFTNVIAVGPKILIYSHNPNTITGLQNKAFDRPFMTTNFLSQSHECVVHSCFVFEKFQVQISTWRPTFPNKVNLPSRKKFD